MNRPLEDGVVGGVLFEQVVRATVARCTPLEALVLLLWLYDGWSPYHLAKSFEFGYTATTLHERLKSAKYELRQCYERMG